MQYSREELRSNPRFVEQGDIESEGLEREPKAALAAGGSGRRPRTKKHGAS